MRFATSALAAFLLLPTLPCQGNPVGRAHPKAKPLASVAVLAVPAIDRGAISAEDATRLQKGLPMRFAIPQPVAANPTTHGTWEVLDATWSLWRLRIQSPEASHINLGFSKFQLPADARLMIYSSDYSNIIRPFTAQDHQPTGALWTPVVRTEEIVVEVYVPTALRAQVQLSLVQVGSGYRGFGARAPKFRAVPPKGPGRDWQTSDIDMLTRGLDNRDLRAGHNLFHAVGCASCHCFADEGGDYGPDLTSLGNRFTACDVLEAILEPSLVISDQYPGSVLTKKDGTAIFGSVKKALHGGTDVYEVVAAAAEATLVRVPAADVAKVEPSKLSPMPKDLVDRLSSDELCCLVAFLLSRRWLGGNK